jgi:hypothetical protein
MRKTAEPKNGAGMRQPFLFPTSRPGQIFFKMNRLLARNFLLSSDVAKGATAKNVLALPHIVLL